MPTITNNMQETCQVIFFFARTKTVSHDPHTQMPYVQPIFPLPGFTRSPFMAPALVRFGFTDAGCNGLGGFRRISQLRETAYSNRQDQIGKG